MRRIVAFGSVAGVLAVAGVALAWQQTSEIEVSVHGHTFHKVAVESRDCTLAYRLWFNAPAEVYSAKSTPRNVYVFRSRIEFQHGKSVVLPVFTNRAPGERVYEKTFDSAPEGCWVRETQKLARVRVEACRGDGCTPDAIE